MSTTDDELDKIAIKQSEAMGTLGFLFWQEKKMTKDEYCRKVYEVEQKAKQAIKAYTDKEVEKAKQEFRDKFHIDPTMKYHVVGTEKAIIVTEWEHHKRLQAQLKEDK